MLFPYRRHSLLSFSSQKVSEYDQATGGLNMFKRLNFPNMFLEKDYPLEAKNT